LYSLEKTAAIDPTQTAFGLVWLVRILFLKSIKPIQTVCFFYLAVQMTFTLKTEPNHTKPNADNVIIIIIIIIIILKL